MSELEFTLESTRNAIQSVLQWVSELDAVTDERDPRITYMITLGRRLLSAFETFEVYSRGK